MAAAAPRSLRPASEIQADARRILDAERRRLAELIPTGELSLTGGSSLSGALTAGDVDLHLRVPAGDFDSAVATLKALYPVVHPEIWQATLATFELPGGPRPAGIAVTPIGSEHDRRFIRTWQLLATQPDRLRAYNAFKARHVRDAEEAYRAAKAEFFAALLGEAAAGGTG